MTTRLRRIFGILMVLVSAGGLILTFAIGFQVWRARPIVSINLNSNLDLIITMIKTSSDSFLIVEDTLQAASDELNVLLETLLTLSNMLKNSDPLIESFQSLTGDSLPETIQATQTSLDTAQQSAEIIDNILIAVTAIPFFPGDPYDPEVPLSESLNQISSSLNSITPAMLDIQSNLTSTKADLAEIDTNITSISDSVLQIQENMIDAKSTITKFKQQIDDAETRLIKAQQSAPGWVDRIATGILFILIWVGLAQISFIFHGINLIRTA